MDKMKSKMMLRTIVISLLSLLVMQLNAQEIEIGKSWEFNEDSNFEGIILSSNFKDSLVENGLLKATVANVFPYLKSEEFELEASDYGIVQLRMKIPGATSGKLNWYNDTGDWGFITFETSGDSTFQEFELPLYLNQKWIGKITKIMSLGFNPTVGSQVEIDYIRIVRKGADPIIANFNSRRTIFKQNVEIPLFASVRNDGDIETTLSSELTLPAGVTLLNGELEKNHGSMFKEISDTLNWTIMFDNLGEYELNLKLFNESDTTETSMKLNVTDQYWVQDKFFLSAWSPPSLTTEAYEYYGNANFDLVLWTPADEVSTAYAEQHEMEYILRAGSLLGEHDNLRAPDNIAPDDLTTEDLAKMDGMIDQFKSKEKVLGYYLTDEPNAKAYPNLGKAVSYLREKDPTRLSFINLLPTYASEEQFGTPTYDEHIEQFLNIVKPEILSYDHYHFFNTYDGEGYFNNLGIIRKWALAYEIPFCNIIQAIGSNGTTVEFLDWRIPNADEHRWLVYSSLAYGAKAIVWFHWDHSWGLTSSPARDELYASIQQLNLEINNIGDILIGLNSEGVYHTQTFSENLLLPSDGIIKSVSENANLVIGYFKDSDNKDFFMIMNKSYNDSAITTITLNGVTDDLQYFNVITKEWEAVANDSSSSNSTFNVTLQKGAGKLYSIGELTDLLDDDLGLAPNEFKLEQNYPNPFNPSTTIKYSIPIVGTRHAPSVQLNVYDVLGRKVRTLVNKEQKPGSYVVKFDASNLSSGLYLYRLVANGITQTKKMILLR